MHFRNPICEPDDTVRFGDWHKARIREAELMLGLDFSDDEMVKTAY